MIEIGLQLQPIYHFGATADIGQIRQNKFLIQRPHDYVWAKTFWVPHDLCPQFLFRKIKVALQYFQSAVFRTHNALATFIRQIKKVDLSRMHLSLTTHTLQTSRRRFNRLKTMLLKNILRDNRCKNAYQVYI